MKQKVWLYHAKMSLIVLYLIDYVRSDPDKAIETYKEVIELEETKHPDQVEWFVFFFFASKTWS